MHCTQVVVCTPYQHQHPGYNPYLWRDSKCYQKGTPGTCEEILRSRKVPPELGEGPEEKHSPIRKDWGCDGVEMGLGRRGRKGEKQR